MLTSRLRAPAALLLLACAAICQTAQAQSAIPANVTVLHGGEDAAAALARSALLAGLDRDEPGVAALLRRPTTLGAPGAPRLTGGKVLTQTVSVTVAPGLSPVVSLDYTAKAGLLYAQAVFTSPHGQTSFATYTPLFSAPTQGTAVFRNAFNTPPGLFAEPGFWTLTGIQLVDVNGVETSYDTAQIARVIAVPGFQLVNHATPDFTPPSVTSGKILTQTVHTRDPLGVFKARLAVSDDISGAVQAILVVEPVSAPSYQYAGTTILPLPLTDGEAIASIPADLLANFPGAWNIVGYGAADVAGNMFLDMKPADVRAVFGAVSFQVD